MNDDSSFDLFGLSVIETSEKYRIIMVGQWGAFSWKGKLKLHWSKYEKKMYLDHVLVSPDLA